MRTDVKLTNDVESFIINQGVALVGIAPVERFQDTPQGYGPGDHMPEL